MEADTFIPVLDGGRGNFPLPNRCIIFIYAGPLQSLRNRVKGLTTRGQSELRVGAVKVRDGETRELKGANCIGVPCGGSIDVLGPISEFLPG